MCDASRIRYGQVRTIPTDTRCARDIMMTMRRLTAAGFTTISAIAAVTGVIAAEIGQPARLNVGVTDRDGQPVGDVVIYATKNGVDDVQRPHPITAVMDQIDTNFVPHILIAQAGALIEFPNSDTISHHVYSFSEARPLELPLYKGTTHPALLFDVPGLVILGCNIHDDMLGYIIVVDTPYFSKSNVDGQAELVGLAPGDYSIHVWTPRLRENSLPPALHIVLIDAEERQISVQFTEKLLPPHASYSGGLSRPVY